jgi:hypothetical protein
MVGRNGLFSGYKSQRTKGHRGEEKGGSHERQRTKIHRAEQKKQGKHTGGKNDKTLRSRKTKTQKNRGGESQNRGRLEKKKDFRSSVSKGAGGRRLYRGEPFYLPLFLLKETEAFVPHDREARTREERSFSGFISQIRPQKRNHIAEGPRESRENTKKSQGKETRQRKKKQAERE